MTEFERFCVAVYGCGESTPSKLKPGIALRVVWSSITWYFCSHQSFQRKPELGPTAIYWRNFCNRGNLSQVFAGTAKRRHMHSRHQELHDSFNLFPPTSLHKRPKMVRLAFRVQINRNAFFTVQDIVCMNIQSYPA